MDAEVRDVVTGPLPSEEPPFWIVTLVHGTWARGFFPMPSRPGRPYWYEGGSRFRSDLDAQLASRALRVARFDTIEWSGSNSLHARSEAASRLTDLLVAQHAAEPAARLLVISHSHGGNVALDVANRTGTRNLPLSVVTLATPFLEVIASEPFVWNVERIAFVAVLFGLSWNLWRLLPADLSVAWTFLAASPLLALTGRLAYSIPRERWLRQNGDPGYVDRLAANASHEMFHRARIPLLVLRGIDDEASLAISTALVGRRISHAARDLLFALSGGRIARRVLNPIFLATIVAALFFTLDPTIKRTMPALFEVFYWLSLTLVGLIVFADLCTGSVGRELIGLRNLEINVNSVPDARENLWVRTFFRQGRRRAFLRHGVYDEPGCAADIVHWMADRTLTDYPLLTMGQQLIIGRLVRNAMPR